MNTFKVGDRVRYKEDGILGTIQSPKSGSPHNNNAETYWIQWEDKPDPMWAFVDEIEMVESQSEEVKTEKVKTMISLKQNREALKKLSSDIEDLELYDQRIKGLEKNIEDFRCRREEIAARIRALGISVD